MRMNYDVLFDLERGTWFLYKDLARSTKERDSLDFMLGGR